MAGCVRRGGVTMTKSSNFAIKGETKVFFEDGSSDALLSMIMALGAEISALSERLDTVIDLLDDRSIVPSSDIDTFQPTPEQQNRRDANRRILVETLLVPLQRQADALADRARADR